MRGIEPNRVSTAIIGGGVAGLSLAYFLGASDFALFEKESEAGGHLKQVSSGEYAFDTGVKCIHDRSPLVREFLEELVGVGNLERGRTRSAFLYEEELHDLPFELNLSLLPFGERWNCLSSFATRRKRHPLASARNFRDFAYASYGEVATRFLLPYAEKTWLTSAEEIDCRGAAGKGSTVPGLGGMIKGALLKPAAEAGIRYIYPNSGMQEVTRKLYEACHDHIHLDSEAVAIDPVERVLTLSNGTRWHYRNLISTIPLPCLMKIMDPAPSIARRAAGLLNFNGMAVLGMELDGRTGRPEHYILIPEKEYDFRRVSFPANFSSRLVPPGRDIMGAEASLARDDPCLGNGAVSAEGMRRRAELIESVQRQVYDSGLTEGRRILGTSLHLFKPAHIVPDHNWAACLDTIHGFLAKTGIQACGRFAEWRYLNIDDTILRAMELARRIRLDACSEERRTGYA